MANWRRWRRPSQGARLSAGCDRRLCRRLASRLQPLRSAFRRSRSIASASDVTTRSARVASSGSRAVRSSVGRRPEADDDLRLRPAPAQAPHQEARMRQRVGVHVGEHDDRRFAEIGLAQLRRLQRLVREKPRPPRRAVREAAPASPPRRRRDCRARRRRGLACRRILRRRRPGGIRLLRPLFIRLALSAFG